MELGKKEARYYIERIAPQLGHDFTRDPVYPEGRNDIGVVVHTAENGSSYGYDVLYLVWKEADGTIRHKELANSSTTKDYIHLKSVTMDGDKINVQFGSGGIFSGAPWTKTEELNTKK